MLMFYQRWGTHEANMVDGQDDSSCNLLLDTIFKTKSKVEIMRLEFIYKAMENRSSITSKVDKLSCSVDEVMKLMWHAKSEERL